MRNNLLDTTDMMIGRPTLWPDGKRYSFYITHRAMMFRYAEVGNAIDAWCKDNLSEEYRLMQDFNQGDPYYSLQCNGEDAAIFVLHFGRAIH